MRQTTRRAERWWPAGGSQEAGGIAFHAAPRSALRNELGRPSLDQNGSRLLRRDSWPNPKGRNPTARRWDGLSLLMLQGDVRKPIISTCIATEGQEISARCAWTHQRAGMHAIPRLEVPLADLASSPLRQEGQRGQEEQVETPLPPAHQSCHNLKKSSQQEVRLRPARQADVPGTPIPELLALPPRGESRILLPQLLVPAAPVPMPQSACPSNCPESARRLLAILVLSPGSGSPHKDSGRTARLAGIYGKWKCAVGGATAMRMF